MFARVGSYQFPPDKIDQAVEAFNRAMESVGQMTGIQDGYCLIDRASGKGGHHHAVGERASPDRQRGGSQAAPQRGYRVR